MLDALLDLLAAHRGDPERCAVSLVAWAGEAASPDDLATDLRTAAAAAALDDGLAGHLLAALLEIARNDPGDLGALQPPDLPALATEVAALEARHAEKIGAQEKARRLEGEIRERAGELAAVERQIAEVRGEVAALADRCAVRQKELEGACDEQPADAIPV